MAETVGEVGSGVGDGAGWDAGADEGAGRDAGAGAGDAAARVAGVAAQGRAGAGADGAAPVAGAGAAGLAGVDLEGAAPLLRAFYARPATTVAPELVGKLLVCGRLVARLVEVEAYLQSDPACHAYRGPTPRTEVLFGPPGHAYVYFTYGMHWCANTVTGEEGHGQGCLLRAAEPLAGLETMRARRGQRVRDRDLLRGPARLAQAFGLDGADNGRDLCAGDGLYVADDGARPRIDTGPRVGVSQAADLPWRFTAAGSAWVSRYTRHPNAP